MTSVAKKLISEPARKNPSTICTGRIEGLNPGPSDYKTSSLNQPVDKVTAFFFLESSQNVTLFGIFLSSLTAERDRETIEELSAALRDEKARAEHMQLALTNERRQTEALKHAKERVDQLRNVNKGNKK